MPEICFRTLLSEHVAALEPMLRRHVHTLVAHTKYTENGPHYFPHCGFVDELSGHVCGYAGMVLGYLLRCEGFQAREAVSTPPIKWTDRFNRTAKTPSEHVVVLVDGPEQKTYMVCPTYRQFLVGHLKKEQARNLRKLFPEPALIMEPADIKPTIHRLSSSLQPFARDTCSGHEVTDTLLKVYRFRRYVPFQNTRSGYRPLEERFRFIDGRESEPIIELWKSIHPGSRLPND